MGKTVDLSHCGGQFVLAVVGMFDCVTGTNLFPAHGSDIGGAKVPTDAHKFAVEPVRRVYASSARTNHPRAHDFPPSKLIYICIIPLCCISYRIEWRGLSGCGGCLQSDGNGNVWAIIALRRNRVPQPQLRIGYGQRVHRLICHDGRHVAPAYLSPTSARYYGCHRGGLRLWHARMLRVLGNWHQGSCVSGFDSADKMHENTDERF